MTSLFNRILVSCPNEAGGLHLLSDGVAYRIDHSFSTGLAISDVGIVIRGIQPATLSFTRDPDWQNQTETTDLDDIHDVLVTADGRYVVGTTRNVVLKYDAFGNKVKEWQFSDAPDSWHINCLAEWNGQIVFSSFGDFEETRGYKTRTRNAGNVRDLLTGKILIGDLSQPHSLLAVGNNLILANSEMLEIREYTSDFRLLRSLNLAGYTRGLAESNGILYVGLSTSRNAEVPHLQFSEVVAVSLESWEEIDRLPLSSKEIYDIQPLGHEQNLVNLLAVISEETSARLTAAYSNQALRFDAELFNVRSNLAELESANKQASQEIALLSESLAEAETVAAAARATVLRQDHEHQSHLKEFKKDAARAKNRAFELLDNLMSVQNELALARHTAMVAQESRHKIQLELSSRRTNDEHQRKEVSDLKASRHEALVELELVQKSLSDAGSAYKPLEKYGLAHDVLHLLETLSDELDCLKQSHSWRITAAMRAIIRLKSRIGNRTTSRHGSKYKFIRTAFQELWWCRALEEIRGSSLFDPEFYLSKYPDLAASMVDPALHFVVRGGKEQRDPSESFRTLGYLAHNPDIALAGVNPLLHYIRHGKREGRSGFEVVVNSNSLHSAGEVHSPASARLLFEGMAIAASGLFDDAFYNLMYPELNLDKETALSHYCEVGWREGRDPSAIFETKFYLDTYKDIKDANINPFWHYVVAGKGESRIAISSQNDLWEDQIEFGCLRPDVHLIAFYKTPDWEAVRAGRPLMPRHNQPFTPSSVLGYYVADDPTVLRRQAKIANSHGIGGFCFEIYRDSSASDPKCWPLDALLADSDVDISFCVKLDAEGSQGENAITSRLVSALKDGRYIKVGHSPVIILNVDSTSGEFIAALSDCLQQEEIPLPYYIVHAHNDEQHRLAQSFIGRGTVHAMIDDNNQATLEASSSKNGVSVVSYRLAAAQGQRRILQWSGYASHTYPAVSIGCDNSASGTQQRIIYANFSTRYFREWLDSALTAVRLTNPDKSKFVFLNDWNGWNDGSFLEPDIGSGYAKLNETSRALVGVPCGTSMPKVSVIVPNYNHAPYLERRLQSIYGQSYKNIEVLLLDDNSSDHSRDILESYHLSHPANTRLIYSDVNSGGAFRQWSKGLKAASGDLIWIAESDDFCDKEFLTNLIRAFADESVMLAYGKSVFVDQKEAPIAAGFEEYISDLVCADQWNGSYVRTSHNEVIEALGVKNTIPNASGVVFRRPVHLSLLEDEQWLSMRVAGDWVFYLNILRGGKIAYIPEAVNFFRRYVGSTAEKSYKTSDYYREVGLASRCAAGLYNLPISTLETCRDGYRKFYWAMVGNSDDEFDEWYNYEAVLRERKRRLPNVLVATMDFSPGGAEILPIRLANEFKRQGMSVLLLSTGLHGRERGIRNMLRSDIPVVETSDVEETRHIIADFGIEALNTHQWHVQKYPLRLETVFEGLNTHVASLHGMIEHGDAFAVTAEQIQEADKNVTTWVYTADKNLGPFIKHGYDVTSPRFTKLANGMEPSQIVPVIRSDLGIPDGAFVLCCVSRGIPDKGWDETIAAVALSRELSACDIHLILVGNGPVYDDYCGREMPNYVHLIGFSENSVGYYAASDMGIMLTKFKSESFPLTIVDCLFSGRPFISTDVGEIPNMLTVDGEVAGAIVPLDDWNVNVSSAAQQIAKFATDQQHYIEKATLVPLVASRYKIDVVAAKYINLFVSNVRA